MKNYTRHLESSTAHSQYNECTFQSDSHLQEELFKGAVGQGSLFLALQSLREVNEINGFKVVTDYTINKVKQYFRPNHFSQNRIVEIKDSKYGFSKNGIPRNESLKNGFSKNENSENENTSFQREMQKAYMKLLSQ